MKKMLLVLAVMMFAVPAVFAGEVVGNPDRYPSLAVILNGLAETGDSRAFTGGISASQNIDVSNGGLLLDLRIPMSPSVTFLGGLGFTSSTVKAQETYMLLGQEMKTSGYSLSLGFRFYFRN